MANASADVIGVKIKVPLTQSFHSPIMAFSARFRSLSPLRNLRMVSTLAPANVEAFFAAKSDAVQPIDATWYLPTVPLSGYHEFMKRRLTKEAVYFDIDAVKDHTKPYPHMLPAPEQFSMAASQLGIKNDAELVFYDQQGIFSACRAAWMFEVFGHDPNKIYFLNTFPAYSKTHGDANLVMKVHTRETMVVTDIATAPSCLPPSDYKVNFDASKVVLYEQLLELVRSGEISNFNLIDARGASRFTGEVEEIRPGMSSGHIPGAINVPFTELLTADKAFLSAMSLRKILSAKGIDESKPTIVSCGSGVTACVVRAAMQLAGYDSAKIAVYDGSWSEWAVRAPKEYIVKGA